MKPKLLCILHRSPPGHGAAKVGDLIASSQSLKKIFDCYFITIKSSGTIGEIGKVSVKKLFFVVELYCKVFLALLLFRPDKIYFTASIKSVAFYRDLLLSTLWKGYKYFASCDVFYHYHTKGIDQFVTDSDVNLRLTQFFVRDVNIILLSSLLTKDFDKVNTIRDFYYLSNGVEDGLSDSSFLKLIGSKYKKFEPLKVLYLSNMIKSKGYFHVLELAKSTRDGLVEYHFAGGWQNSEDEKEFFRYIRQHELTDIVTFHGFVNGDEKAKLFKSSHVFIFPTRYENEAFPLSILEALSFGLPVISTDEGSIPFMLDSKSGIVLQDVNELPEALEEARRSLINEETSIYCRSRFSDNFSLSKFESSLVEVLS